ncbi:MAG: electron transfer flavoprotein subunit beta/FixA family protein [Planctomycetota bacterium]
MDIIVCVKRVPATDTQVKVAPDGTSLDPAGVEFVLNPYDEFAVEEALKTREAKGGTVTAITLGPAEAQKELRTCLAMGADKAILIKTGDRVHDGYSTAEILVAQIKQLPHDLVFCGRQAVDGDNSQAAPRIAALLGWPCVTDVTELALEGDAYVAHRDIEGGREVVRCPLPAVISTNKGLNEPRYASLKGIMAAKKKPLEEVEAADVAPATAVVSLSLPPARPEGRIVEGGADAVAALVDAIKNEAKVL